MEQTELLIHGHSCLEIRSKSLSLICDPWLLGSTYWRSWWNFPESPDLDSLLEIWSKKEKVYIYITHLHWDHFHGPTLRKIKRECKNCQFIIPKTPEARLKFDLESVVGGNCICEIGHTETLNLSDGLSVLSFQVGPFFADSILSINSSEFNILNMNDAKILDFSLAHLLSMIPKPNYVLRSHSSANDRCCYRNIEGEFPKSKIDKTRFEYSKEFFDACYATSADFAIPFASNMACLHRDTFQYNSILNFSDYVINDFELVKSDYKNMECQLLLPSEKIILETKEQIINIPLRNKLRNQSRENYLISYQNEKSHILFEQYKLEDEEIISYKLLNKYFKKIINSTPYLLKKYLNNKIYLEVFSRSKNNLINIDFIKGTIKEKSIFPKKRNNVKVRVSAYVINDVCKKNHWNSLGVSKRLEICTNALNNRYIVFNFLCNTIESGGFLPIKNIFNFRFISIWLKRYREIIDLIIYSIKIKLAK